MNDYFTIAIPYTPTGRTLWHPTEPSGPFAVQSRGAFATESEARDWAERELGDTTYAIRQVFPLRESWATVHLHVQGLRGEFRLAEGI